MQKPETLSNGPLKIVRNLLTYYKGSLNDLWWIQIGENVWYYYVPTKMLWFEEKQFLWFKERFENPTIDSFITIIDFLSSRQIAIKERIRI